MSSVKMSSVKMASVKMASVELNKSVKFNMKSKKWYFKSKPFDCMKLSKPEAQKIAHYLQLNPKGFMKDICKTIDTRLDLKQRERRTALRKKFRLLKMKQAIKNYV